MATDPPVDLFGDFVDDTFGLLAAPFVAAGKGLLNAPEQMWDMVVGD